MQLFCHSTLTSQTDDILSSYNSMGTVYKRAKVKLCHTHYQVLGLELIPVYRQSAHR